MKKSFVWTLLIVLVLFTFGKPAGAATRTIIVKQGNSAVLSFTGVPLAAEFGSSSTPFFAYKNSYRVVVGIPATKTPGRYPLTLEFKDGRTLTYTIVVASRKFPLIALGVPSKLNLTPQALVAELTTQNSGLNVNIFSSTTPEIYFTAPFGLPLRDNRNIGSIFGEIRQTGGEQIRHLGVDFGAPRGASVVAINAGRIVKAYVDPVYGNAVIIDHGEGIYSFYLHLDKSVVTDGQLVKKGQLIGAVGDTGYASAPHLHLSIKINGVSVDPLNFVNNFR